MLIAIFNQAGGVGKTTLTRDLGYELSLRNQRVLVIDADPQGTLGSFLGFDSQVLPEDQTFWKSVISDADLLPHVISTPFNLALGVCNRMMIAGEIQLMQEKNPARFRGILSQIRSGFDVILVDCPPRVSEITVQVLLAADGLLIPVQTEFKAVSSFAEVQVEISKTQRRRRDMGLGSLKVLGVVPTLFDTRLKVHSFHLDELRTQICPEFHYQVLSPFRKYKSVIESGTFRKPLRVFDKNCPANDDVAAIAEAVLQSLNPQKQESRHTQEAHG